MSSTARSIKWYNANLCWPATWTTGTIYLSIEEALKNAVVSRQDVTPYQLVERTTKDTAVTAQWAAWHPDPAANIRHSDTAGIYI